MARSDYYQLWQVHQLCSLIRTLLRLRMPSLCTCSMTLMTSTWGCFWRWPRNINWFRMLHLIFQRVCLIIMFFCRNNICSQWLSEPNRRCWLLPIRFGTWIFEGPFYSTGLCVVLKNFQGGPFLSLTTGRRSGRSCGNPSLQPFVQPRPSYFS